MARTWGHSYSLLQRRGKVKYVCSCGGQSPWLESHTDLAEWAVHHSGLRFQTEKKRGG